MLWFRHMYLHSYTYIRTSLYILTYIHTSSYIRTYLHPYTYIHTYIHMYILIHTYLHPYTYVHTYIHTYIYPYTYILTSLYIRTYVHTCIHTYIHPLYRNSATVAVNYCSPLIYSAGVNVFFDPDTYNVTEGETAVITLRAVGEFAVPFDVIVTIRDGSAVGEYWYTELVQYEVYILQDLADKDPKMH